ncbi:MAG: tRNA adenosine(34) deaminase TadA [Deltaproteobacteria bacterium]|nr:tRNA adenosine(34) deaminase TadA [Deltaproteobacteria bacterium]
MEEALREARKALKKGEVPVGAVIAQAGVIIGRGHNSKEKGHDPSAHAEMLAIRSAAKKLKGWRISHSTLYVTLEPCLMCMGALIQARIPRLVFAAFDPKAGACGSLYDVSNDKRLNHRIDVASGVCGEEASALLKGFFKALRDKKKRA